MELLSTIIQAFEITALGFGVPASIILGYLWYEMVYKENKRGKFIK